MSFMNGSTHKEDLEVVSLDEISQEQYDDFVDYSDGIERA